MSKLTYIKDFDTYFGEQVFEQWGGRETIKMKEIFCKPGPIKMSDGNMIDPNNIWKYVNDAFRYLQNDYKSTMRYIGNRMNIIMLRYSSDYETMAVDNHLNMYINAGFVYNISKIADSATERDQLIGGVIMHELYHVLFKHIDRSKVWLRRNNKTWTEKKNDLNLAADTEVNQSLIHWHILTEEQLVKKIRGIYIKSTDSNNNFRVKTLETCLDDENYMNMLRAMHPAPPDGLIIKDLAKEDENEEQDKIQTSSEWDKGYKDAWNKLAELISKYGYQTVWTKLQEQGIINAVGEYDPTNDIKDIMSIEFLTIKSFDEFINENNEQSNEESGRGQTYDEGFAEATNKIISQLSRVIMGNDDDEEEGEGLQGGPNSPKLKSDLDENDLKPIDLPIKDKKKKKGGDGDDVPQPFRGKSSDDDNEDNKDNEDQKQGQGGGSSQKSKASDKDIKDFADKLMNGSGSNLDSKEKNGSGNSDEKKSNSAEKGSNTIGGTGSFMDEEESQKNISSVLKESGYDEESMKQIEDMVKQNAEYNSDKEVQFARELLKSSEHGGALAKFLKEIDTDLNKSLMNEMWKNVMKKFLDNHSRRAGLAAKSPFKKFVLRNPAKNIQGFYNQKNKKEAQEPQDLNVYVDVSGSMNMDLLRVISQTLVEYAKQFKFSNINICPWASTSNGVFTVESLYDQVDSKLITQEILDIISRGESECGGGTNGNAAMVAMIQVIKQTLNDPKKKKKDDVHVVISDGQFDFRNIESRMSSVIGNTFSNSIGQKAIKNTFWMLYDVNDYGQNEWGSEIKEGKLIFVESKEMLKLS